MSNDEPQQTEWEAEVGLSEETTYVAGKLRLHRI